MLALLLYIIGNLLYLWKSQSMKYWYNIFVNQNSDFFTVYEHCVQLGLSPSSAISYRRFVVSGFPRSITLLQLKYHISVYQYADRKAAMQDISCFACTTKTV